MLSFLSGEDSFRVRERAKELATEFGQRFPATEYFSFDFEENFTATTLTEIRETLSGGLFATPRVVMIRQVGMLPDEATEALRTMLVAGATSKDCRIIISQQGKPKKSHPLISWLAKQKTAEVFPKFDEKNLGKMREYAQDLLKRIDPTASIERGVLERLMINAQGDSGRLFQELTKLVRFKTGGEIKLADVELLSVEPMESQVFQALDALVAGQRGLAVARFRREEKAAVPVQKTLALCAWQLRRLIEVEELFRGGMREAGAIARELKASPYPIQKILPRLATFPAERLRRGMALLADLDLRIRSGRVDPSVALDLFVWKF